MSKIKLGKEQISFYVSSLIQQFPELSSLSSELEKDFKRIAKYGNHQHSAVDINLVIDFWFKCWELDRDGNEWKLIEDVSIDMDVNSTLRNLMRRFDLFDFLFDEDDYFANNTYKWYIKNLHGLKFTKHSYKQLSYCYYESPVSRIYSDFLKSDYWSKVRKAKLTETGSKCQHCGCSLDVSPLQVHHKTYEFKGREHLHLDSLEVLCKTCHIAHHIIESKDDKATRHRKFGLNDNELYNYLSEAIALRRRIYDNHLTPEMLESLDILWQTKKNQEFIDLETKQYISNITSLMLDSILWRGVPINEEMVIARQYLTDHSVLYYSFVASLKNLDANLFLHLCSKYRCVSAREDGLSVLTNVKDLFTLDTSKEFTSNFLSSALVITNIKLSNSLDFSNVNTVSNIFLNLLIRILCSKKWM